MLAILFSVLTATGTLALVGYTLWIGAKGAPPSDPQSLPTREEMRRFVLWRSFYVNPDDPRGWVPKLSGIGWTPNFRTRRAALVFALLIVATTSAAVGLLVAVSG